MINAVNEVNQAETAQVQKKKVGTDAVSSAFEALLAAMMSQTANVPVETMNSGAGSTNDAVEGAVSSINMSLAQEVIDMAGGSLNQGMMAQPTDEEAVFEMNISGEIPQPSSTTSDLDMGAGIAFQPDSGVKKMEQLAAADEKVEVPDETKVKHYGKAAEESNKAKVRTKEENESVRHSEDDNKITVQAKEENRLAEHAKDSIEIKAQDEEENKPVEPAKENNKADVLAKETHKSVEHPISNDKQTANDGAEKKTDRLRKFLVYEKDLGSIDKDNINKDSDKAAKSAGIDEGYRGFMREIFKPQDSEAGKTRGNGTDIKQLISSNKEDILSQIYDKIKVTNVEDMTELHISLKPEELGEIVIKLIMDKGAMSGRILVENSQVKDLVEANLQGVKDNLREQNLNLSDINIFVGPGNQNFYYGQGSSRNKWMPDRAKHSSMASVSNVEDTGQVRDMYHSGELNLLV